MFPSVPKGKLTQNNLFYEVYYTYSFLLLRSLQRRNEKGKEICCDEA